MKKPQIMIVEDEGLVALEIKEALQHMGYDVPNVVASGQESLDVVLADRPDLIVMDIRLEGSLDGIEAARRIKDIFNIPIIYLTADLNDNTLQRAKTTESYGYIIKPFEERALRATIEIALSKAEKDRENREENEWNDIIVRNLHDGVIAADPKGIVTRINHIGLMLLGRSEKDCVGRKLAEVVRILDAQTGIPEVLSITKTIIDDEIIEKGDCHLITNEKKSAAIEYRMAPLKNKNRNTTGIILFLKRTRTRN